MKLTQFELSVAGQTWPVMHAVPAVAAPRPAVLVMLQGERLTALNEPYRQGLELAVAAGCHVISYDMPFHGDARRAGWPERLAGVAQAMMAGEDPFDLDTLVGRSVVTACVAQGLAEPGRIGIVGVSRGGYCGVRLMAAEPGIAAVAAVAPVTDWRVLGDFNPIDRESLGRRSLHELAGAVADRPLWVAIGANDDRVSTERCREWVESVRAAAAGAGAPDRVEFIVEPDSIGHTVPAPRYGDAARFILRQLQLA